jgi:catechol 2,3-dioxygenase-like lactoylglutathione lyase family enzyme
MKLGPSLVMTPDLGEALTFYREVLGLTLQEESATQLIFGSGTWALHVFQCEAPAAAQQHGRDASSVISFEVGSLAETMVTLQARGVEFLHAEPARNELASLSYAAFRAPGGNVHELVQRDQPAH